MSEYPEQEQNDLPVVEEAPKRRKWLSCVLVAAVVVLLLACVAVVVVLVVPYVTGEPILPDLPIPFPFLGQVGEEILLAFPSRSGLDLYLLELGQTEDEGILLAEDAAGASVYLWERRDGRFQGTFGGDFGGFVPDSDRVFLWYRLEDEVAVKQMRIGDQEAIEVLESGEGFLHGDLFLDSGIVFLVEPKPGQSRCYVVRPGVEAERVAKADRCDVSPDGLSIVFSEEDAGETTVTVADINGENEQVILDGVEGVDSYRFSDDVSHFAYVEVDRGEAQLHLVERSSGDDAEIGDEVENIAAYSFAPGSDVLYYTTAEIDDGEVVRRLFASDDDDPIAEGPALKSEFAPDGQSLVYLLGDEDGEEVLYVHPLDGGDDVKVVEGEEIGFSVLDSSPPRIVAISLLESEYRLYSAGIDGQDLVELLGDDSVSFEATLMPDESLVYVQMRNEDDEASLFVTPVDEAVGSFLVEGWESVMVRNLSPDGRQLVFAGREDPGDDHALYVVPTAGGAKPVELDDDIGTGMAPSARFYTAVFSADGRFVIYNAATGDAVDDVEVRRVPVDGKEDYEVLYEEAFLTAARWDDVFPNYRPVRWQTATDILARVVVGGPVEEVVVTVVPAPTEEPVPVPTEEPAVELERVNIRWFVGLGIGAAGDQVAVAEDVVAEFNASQDRIELELEVYEYSVAKDVLMTMIAAGDPPDIVGPMSTIAINDFPDVWLDLSGWADLDAYHWAPIETMWADYGGVVGLPVLVYPSFLYYNRDLFDAAALEYPPHQYDEAYADGDEWTIEKMEEIAMLLTLDENDNNATSAAFDPESIVQFGFSTQWESLRGQATLFGAGSFVDSSGDVAIPDHWREALNWFYDGMWEKYFIPDSSIVEGQMGYNSFDSGKVAMTYSHLWYTCCLGNVPNWDIAFVPSYDGYPTAPLEFDIIGALDTTEYPDEAVEALEYVATNPELLQAWGAMPAVETMWDDYFAELDEKFSQGVDWRVAIDSLDWADIPNHWSYLPNFPAADDRIVEFQDLYESASGLDLDAEIDELVADLQAIFDEAE